MKIETDELERNYGYWGVFFLNQDEEKEGRYAWIGPMSEKDMLSEFPDFRHFYKPVEEHYEIHWLVPAKNAIGGKAYWTPVDIDDDGRKIITDIDEAKHLFAIAEDNYDKGSIRLMVVRHSPVDNE